MKIMAVDYGDARTGLAVCDRTEFLASPVGVIEERNFYFAIQKVAHAVQEYDVQMVIVGYPVNMNGTIGERAEKSLEFKEKLENRTGLPGVRWDERLTTAEAERTLMETGVRRENRKQFLDQMAAVLILQGYLDRMSMMNKEEENGEN